MSRLRNVLMGLVLTASSTPAVAGEADDLQRMVDVAKQGVKDLERLDEHKAVREDLTMLDVWLDHAWKLRSDQKYDEVRVVLDRCQAQADMIRHRIAASKLLVQAAQKEAELQRVREQIAKSRSAVAAARLKKASLEGRMR